ncbi:alcohol dehydrogenase catalytic domain-containing protein [Marinactinospora rubrisoli]|uniref:Alcohol dehydrogenase catalytic domain-containing protein n=1 Tax=Marinactinospora rubrisoli TaxID=2715399 RepID=A0ABW2KDV4_9ACTN
MTSPGRPAALLLEPRKIEITPLPVPEPGPGQVQVAVHSVGLCGSDLHYYAEGRNGPNVLRAPCVLGHEGAGTITAVGAGVPAERVGERVAIEPAHPCGDCELCRGGRYNLCRAGRCFGSPPTHGLLRSHTVLPAAFAHPLPGTVGDDEAALVEPLAVAVWAVRRGRVGPGDRVLVTGAGPIGLLSALAALRCGAAEVTVHDVDPVRLAAARAAVGGTGVQVRDAPPGGEVDRLLECSGAPAALRAAERLAPGGVLALVGTPSGAPPAELTALTQRWEFDVAGCFRYGPASFTTAVAWAATGLPGLRGLVTARYPLAEAAAALERARTDRSQLKVVIDVTAPPADIPAPKEGQSPA